MSTYLVAFIVSDFDVSPTLNNFHRTFTRPSKIETSDMALKDGEKILDEIGKYLGRDYKIDMFKMDQIGIPQFAAGAMENWGLVTYR